MGHISTEQDETVELVEGCYCGHGAYHHEGGGWPLTPVNGRCCERGCDCSEFQRAAQ